MVLKLWILVILWQSSIDAEQRLRRLTGWKFGQWVLYFNPWKLREKQIKWCRQFERPYLFTATPFTEIAKIYRTAKMTAKTVHIDKLKIYLKTALCSWLTAATNDDNRTVDPEPATNAIPPDILIGPIRWSAEQQSTPWPIYRRRADAGKQKGLGQYIPNPTLLTSIIEEGSPVLSDSQKAVVSLSSKMDDSSMQRLLTSPWWRRWICCQ